MDHRLNNEALVACLVAHALNKGPMDMLRISMLIPYVSVTPGTRDYIFSEVYKGFLPVVVNASSMLVRMGAVAINNNMLSLTDKGIDICRDMVNNVPSLRFARLAKRLDDTIITWNSLDNLSIYQKLNIFLTE